MHKSTLTLLIGGVALLAGAGLLVPNLLSEPDVPVARWQAQDEIEVPAEPTPLVNGSVERNGGVERSAVDSGSLPAGADERVEVVLRGRVVDKYKAPIAQATVWLDYGRGGPRGGPRPDPNRRVPDPVRTDAEGRFAFQGETFRDLRVSLQVAHGNFAVAQFDKNVGRVAEQDVDLGDLMLAPGGEVRGRVTDLEGNGVPDALLRLQPESENPLRMLRDRERMLPPFATDQNGYFRRQHVAAGDWSVSATAKRHTEGRSATFAVAEEQATDVEDIRLGPGYELAGTVHSTRGEPIAKANVVLQSEARRTGRAGPGGGGPGGGREHRTTTDAEGRFFLEHLPATTMRLQADADGYLNTRVESIDPTLGKPIAVTMPDGLRIEGRVRDGSGAVVTLFAFRAERVRGLQTEARDADLAELMNRLRDTNLSEEMRNQLRVSAERMRAETMVVRSAAAGGRVERGGPVEWVPGVPGRGAQLDKPEQHPDGTFVATGLQEGVYEVHVQSPEHARYRSAEVELRTGAVPPKLEVVLDGGVSIAGVVVDTDGAPVRGATVELRTPPPEGAGRPRGRSGGNGVVYDFGISMPEAMRFAGGPGQATLEAKTDGKGAFLIKHVPRGTYRLQADARGFANASTESFDLQADRSDFELRLGNLGSIAGEVTGLRPEEIPEARVGAMPIGNAGTGPGAPFGRGHGGGGPFNSVQVAADGTYRIEELVPGEYVVRAWLGSPEALMRELGPRFGDGTLRADAAVAASKTTKLDVAVSRPQVGTVEGTVTNNGNAATGWSVELVPQNPAGNAGGGPGGIRWTSGTLRANVASSGRFSIAKVPAGNYTLRVQGGGGPGQPQGRSMMHEEIVLVLTGATLERSIALFTHSLQGTVTRDDGGNAAEITGAMHLLRGATSPPENMARWMRENGGNVTTEVRAGAFRFDDLPPGAYLLMFVSPLGRTQMQVSVQGNQTVTVALKKEDMQPLQNPPGGAGGNNPPPNGGRR